MKAFSILILLLVTSFTIDGFIPYGFAQSKFSAHENLLRAVINDDAGTISIFRNSGNNPILVQNAQKDMRPYIHPIVAPDGKGILTQLRPGHHTHQTGLFWGLKRVNGRDYFKTCCTPGQKGYYRRVSFNVTDKKGQQVRWQTVYDLLDEKGEAILTETHEWSLQEYNGEFILDLEWEGQAQTDITVGKYFVGGLFLRMPWYKGIDGKVINAAGQVNDEAEAQRAIWADVGMQIKGREDWGHIAIFDHPDNKKFPISWRVDSQLGVGPSRQIKGDWKLDEGEAYSVRYRLIIYTGDASVNAWQMNRRWIKFIQEY